MRWFLILLLSVMVSVGATTYTEFYCDAAGGTNINSGSTTNAIAIYTSVNGNWDGTSVFTPTDGSTPASTVSAGMWASVYTDGQTNLSQAAITGGCIALVTNVAAGANGAITVDRRTFSGAAPTTSATGRSLKIGGAWQGPYGTIGFPIGFITLSSTNGPAASVRVNFKATSTYAVTAAMTQNQVGPIAFEGCSLVPGDGGMATIDGGTSATTYVLLTVSGTGTSWKSFTFSHNGAAGNQSGVSQTTTACIFRRCVFSNMRRSGVVSAGQTIFWECEAFGNNTQNTVNQAGFNSTGNDVFMRCISHDNPGANSYGWFITGMNVISHCVSYNNGFGIGGSTTVTAVRNCDIYSNNASGIDLSKTTASVGLIENCNIFKNKTYGIDCSANTLKEGYVINCVFGSGTEANISGDLSPNALACLNVSGSITYASGQTPFVDAVNGNFTLPSSSTIKAAGNGYFLQSSVNSPTNTVSFPDIGASQLASTNSSGGGSWTFSQ